MNVAIRIERNGDVFTVVAEGAYTREEMQGALNDVLASPDLPPHPGLLLDLRRSESMLRRSIPDMRAISHHFLVNADRFDRRVGLLVEGVTRYGLMRMVSMWLESAGIDARVSRDDGELHRWLSVAPGIRTAV